MVKRHYVETEQRVKTAGDNSARMEVSHADGESKIFLQPEGIIQEEGMITISADTRAMLNKYAEIRVTMHAFFDGMRIFRRGVEIRRKQGLTSEGLLHGIEVAKAEYRKLRVESLNLRKKLLEVMSWKKILEGCKQYAARCGRVRRRYIGK